MLITKEVEVGLMTNIKYYENLGYKIPRYKNKQGQIVVKRGTKILVNVNDLPNGTRVKVDVKCDNCGEEKQLAWVDYQKSIKEDGKYYCQKCAMKLYGRETCRKTLLLKGKSFEQWCLENNRQDVLGRWDYKLNKLKPSEVNCNTETEYYFKCPKEIHTSELKSLYLFTSMNVDIICKQCKSVGFLRPEVITIWSDKNNKSPFEYFQFSNKEVWWKCPNGKHEDYLRSISNSNVYNFRCPECNNASQYEVMVSEYLIGTDESYTYQITFDGLIGMSGGLLSYDFYIPRKKLLIEVQGEYHDQVILKYKNEPIELAEARLIKQKEHDRRKKEYALNNGYNFLEIWYWDINRVEEILLKELSLQESDFCILKEEK